MVVSNLTPVPREGYRIGVPLPGLYREAINTDSAAYGGSNMSATVGGVRAAEDAQSHGHPYSRCALTLPPLGDGDPGADGLGEVPGTHSHSSC